jgi:photosystem II stability/assembly factor-like uncharacterized protein
VFRSSDRGKTWQVSSTPLPGDSSSGIFAIAFRDAKNGMAVGGNYLHDFRRNPQGAQQNVLRTRDGGVTWTLVGRSDPPGVLYGATYAMSGDRMVLLVSGPPGSGISSDDGTTWLRIDTLPLNTVSAARHGTSVFAAGVKGRIARIKWTPGTSGSY